MKKLIMPSIVEGKISAPSSKNLTQRALLSAMLAKGESKLVNTSFSQDVEDLIKVLQSFNVKIEKDIRNKIIYVDSKNLKYTNEINCGESAFCLRALVPILSLFDNKKTFTGTDSLLKRSIIDLSEIEKFGIKFESNNGFLPGKISGELNSEDYTIDSPVSSQMISGLLMTLPLLNNDSHLKIFNPVSKHYLDMTVDILKHFNIKIDELKYNDELIEYHIKGGQVYNPSEITLENDWSNSALLIVIAALNGKLLINNINIKSIQGDKIIIDILKQIGAEIITKSNSLFVKSAALRAFEFDAVHNPDIVPALMVLALKCKGVSKISGINRLKHKESSRAKALSDILISMGADIKLNQDDVIIRESNIYGGEADSHNDHRIVTALAAAGIFSQTGIVINNIQDVNKSYPEFFNDLDNILIGKRNEHYWKKISNKRIW